MLSSTDPFIRKSSSQHTGWSCNNFRLRKSNRQHPCATKSKIFALHAACNTNRDRNDTVCQTVALPDLPATYKRLAARRCGPSFREVAVVQELPLQPPGPGEVLIRITHAGVNGGCETFRARGEHAFAANRGLQGFPLGAEGAGVVVALGPGMAGGSLQVGQRVAVNGAAAFSQFITSRPSLVVPLPEEVGTAEGAALVLSGVTAAVALEATARVRPGEGVVVTAAAGGTGHFAVQLAAAAGATVVAIVGSGGGGGEKAAAVAALGAHHVIDRWREDVPAALRLLFPGGVDVVFEGVGGSLRNQLLGCLSPSGRLLQVGYISEYPHARSYPWEGSGAAAGPDRSDGSSGSSGSDGSSGNHMKTASDVPTFESADEVEQTTTAELAAKEVAVASKTTSPTSTSASAVAASAAAAAPTTMTMDSVPSSADLFWGGLDVSLDQRRRVIGQIWPKDPKAILRCRRRVFELARGGKLKALTDTSHGRKGVEGVADAVEYMLQGRHVGKVIIEL